MTSKTQQFFDSMWPLCVAAGAKTGIHPEIIFAQSALETGFGLHAPHDNYFGIKGDGPILRTTEYVAGTAVKLQQRFAVSSSMAASVADYTRFVGDNKRYRAFRSPGTIAAQLAALQKSGYATDPDYINKLAPIIDEIPALEKKYNSPIGALARATQSPIVTLPPSPKASADLRPSMMADKQETKSMSDLSKFMHQHAGVLNVAANVIKGLVEFAPIPAPAAAAVGNIVSALQQHATNVQTVADGLAVASPEIPAQATGVTSSLVQPPVQSLEGTALQAAIAESEQLLTEVIGDFTKAPPPGETAVQEIEHQSLSAAEDFGKTLIGAAENLLQPIAKPPTGN